MSAQKAKNEKRHDRIAQKERLTNMYMINFTWGIVGILAFLYIGSLYKNTSVLVHMQTINWVLTAIFAVAAVVLFVLAKTGVIKNTSRANNYGIFMGVCALFGLWLALYNKIRPVMEIVAQKLLGNSNLMVSSYWNTRIPIIAICIYLVVAFIVYAIKVTKN